MDIEIARYLVELLHWVRPDEVVEAASDERGGPVPCPACGGDCGMYYAACDNVWYCRDCGYEMDRHTFLDHIRAALPMPECQACMDNYPVCRIWCEKSRSLPGWRVSVHQEG